MGGFGERIALSHLPVPIMAKQKNQSTGIGNVTCGVLVAVAIIGLIWLGFKMFTENYADKKRQEQEAIQRHEIEAEERNQKWLKDKAEKFVGPKMPTK